LGSWTSAADFWEGLGLAGTAGTFVDFQLLTPSSSTFALHYTALLEQPQTRPFKTKQLCYTFINKPNNNISFSFGFSQVTSFHGTEIIFSRSGEG
jgi:hypothetical protein